jgi:hypothetical protein
MGPRDRLLSALIALYLLGLGFLGGALSERMRFDRARAAILTQLEAAVARAHGQLMMLERRTAMGARAGWEPDEPTADAGIGDRAFE